MVRIDKTVFISYRRADRWPALAVFKDLTQHGYDVFIDYDGIASGDFERAIVDNIRARAHFVVVLTPTALERCDDPADWLRREIEAAIEARRNIVPLLLDGFTFGAPIAVQRLRDSLEPLRRYQALKVPEDFFDAAMERLRGRYLTVAVEAVLHPASAHAQHVAQEQRDAASRAAARAPEKYESLAHSAQPPARPPAQAQPAAAATREGQATATVKPVNSKLNAREYLVVPIVAAGAVLVWAAVTSGKKEEAPTPLAPAASSVGAGTKATAPVDGPSDAAAQGALADDYYYGRNGRTQDDAEAVKWYRKAAEQANAEAQVSLGFMYREGRGGLAKDDAEAVKWYRKAAEQSNSQGQVSLGFMYREGRGGPAKDDVEAVKWYRKAAAQGNADGQANLGFMYFKGRGGLAKDDAEAVKWYRKAAEQGNSDGQVSLGVMYEQGEGGLAKDDAEAVKWYRKAAEAGSADGQAYLADMYERGAGGLAKDRTQALKLYRKAATQGSDYAASALKRLGET